VNFSVASYQFTVTLYLSRFKYPRSGNVYVGTMTGTWPSHNWFGQLILHCRRVWLKEVFLNAVYKEKKINNIILCT